MTAKAPGGLLPCYVPELRPTTHPLIPPQPHWPQPYFFTPPNIHLPQGLYTYYSCCLKCSSLFIHRTHSNRFLLKHHFFEMIYLPFLHKIAYHLLSIPPLHLPQPCFLFLQSHLATDMCIHTFIWFYFLTISNLPECELYEGRGFSSFCSLLYPRA